MNRGDKTKSVGLCKKLALWRALSALYDILLGRVGVSISLKGQLETLYPKMNKREVCSLADEICRKASESAL